MRLFPLAALLSLALAAPACGDDGGAVADDDAVTPDAAPDPGPDAPTGPLLDRLRALPGVVSVTELPTDNAGYRRFDVRMEQPVDAADPDGQTFVQQMTLLHRDEAAPTILVSTGYWNYYGDNLSELADLLAANQIVVEHRYFGESRPDPADWTKLTIVNAAHDHHRIVEAFRRIYGAAWLTTGASKGGMTSVYHRRFFPDDVEGTVPYVAPQSFGAPDYRYDAFVDGLGTPACRQALQDLEVELLARRAMLEERAQAQATSQGLSYTRVALAPAVESAVASLYWAFWQYYGVGFCGNVPATTASDDRLWQFLDAIAPVSDSDDDSLAQFDAYYFQAAYELGYPGTMDTWLDGRLLYGPDDYTGTTPVGVSLPAFRPEAMTDVDAWVQAEGSRLLFIYGQWDPWSGGEFELGNATDSLRVEVPEGTHGSRIADLEPADRSAALAKLAAWTGVTPQTAALARRRAAGIVEPAAPRMPPAVRQALRLRTR